VVPLHGQPVAVPRSRRGVLWVAPHPRPGKSWRRHHRRRLGRPPPCPTTSTWLPPRSPPAVPAPRDSPASPLGLAGTVWHPLTHRAGRPPPCVRIEAQRSRTIEPSRVCPPLLSTDTPRFSACVLRCRPSALVKLVVIAKRSNRGEWSDDELKEHRHQEVTECAGHVDGLRTRSARRLLSVLSARPARSLDGAAHRGEGSLSRAM